MLLSVTILCVLKVRTCLCIDYSSLLSTTDYDSKIAVKGSSDAKKLDHSDLNEVYDTKPKFKDKVVLITGASSGLGEVIAHYFSVLGARLILTGKNFDKLEKVSKRCREYGASEDPYIPSGDLTNTQHVKYIVTTAMDHYKRLDILVNCAGIMELGSIKNTSLDQYDRTFAINVRGMYDVTMQCVPFLKESKGTIINISSVDGTRPFTGKIAYCMSKAAVDQFTRCLALELAHFNVRVNSINPGVVATGMHMRHGMTAEEYENFIKFSVHERVHPLGRIATEDDVARAVVFLASDLASFTTGLNFPVDGGRGIACPR